MPSLKDKIIVVTGASSGIGLVTARTLAARGAKVVMVARNADRGEAARASVLPHSPSGQVDLLLADLAKLDDVRNLAGFLHSKYDRIDALLNNAGAMHSTLQHSAEGYEMTMAVNHLAHFALTLSVLDLLRAAHGARIVNVSSEAHRMGKVALNDLHYQRRSFNGWSAYADSKLMNLLFTYELDRRLADTGLTVNAMHPGVVATNFASDTSRWVRGAFRLARPFLRSPEAGAETLIFLASSPTVAHTSGQYFKDNRPARSSSLSHNTFLAAKLWDVSETLTGVTFKD
jgi:NAD(P)-dependent dehydrogenase (short-subunit alcohol dehydrogenase family)